MPDTRAAPFKEAHDLVLELSVRLAGVVAVADVLDLEPEVPEKVRGLLGDARNDLVEAAEYLQRLRCVLEDSTGSDARRMP